MASTDIKSKPGLGRSNTFQKMLDLEQKNKVNRMRASSTFPAMPTSTPRSPPPPKSNLRQHPPVPIPSIDRAMTAPELSLAVPPPNPTSGDISTRYVARSRGDVILQAEDLSDAESDASSICRSPGWEDYNGKKRKKEIEEARDQRRRELDMMNRNVPPVHQAQKPESLKTQSSNRLSKAPPTNKRLTKMSISTDRSVSAPAVATLPTMARGDVRKEDRPIPEKVKRGSLDTGLKGFITATQAIPGPWKSSQNPSSSNTATQEAPLSRKSFSRKPGTYNDEGFIGGLKLEQFRQTETVVIQQIKQEPKKVVWSDETPGHPHIDRDASGRGASTLSNSISVMESVDPVPIYEGSVRTRQQFDAVYAHTAAAACHFDSPGKVMEDNTPIMERNIRKARRSHPPTSNHSPVETQETGSSQRDNSNDSRSRPAEVKSGQTHPQVPAMSPSADSPLIRDSVTRIAEPLNTNDPKFRNPDRQSSKPAVPIKKSYPPESRGRADYIRYRRHEEELKAAMASKDESDISDAATNSKKPRSRRGSFSSLFSRSRSRTRSSSEAPTIASVSTIGATTKKESPATSSFSTIGGSNKSAKKDAKTSGVFLDEEYVLNQLHLELNTKASESAMLGHKRASSKGPSFQSLKSAAKSAFSRRSSVAPESPSDAGSFTTAPEVQASSSKAPSSKRTSLEAASPHISALMKPDSTIVHSTMTPIAHDFSLPKLPSRSPARSPVRPGKDFERSSRSATPKALTGSNNRSNHSRSATDSSEDHSTLDGSSTITTPNASRPQSQKDFFSVKGDSIDSAEPLNRIPSSTLQGLNGATSTTPVLFDETASNYDSRLGTDAELVRVGDEDRPKTLSCTTATFDFTTTHMNNTSSGVDESPLQSAVDTSDIQRTPSLSRSTSTPELQDLSFLPALKHQPLTRPVKAKDKVVPPNKFQQPSKYPEEADKALVRPQPIPIATTKSAGSSPTSPQSSQYLHNARLSIPGACSPPKTSFLPGSHHQNGPDPIAKMFVICCQCKYFHDMPSKIYECMAKPENIVTDKDLGVSGVISTSVKCPWCGHGMGTSCCAGYAAVVYLNEKLH